MPEPLVARSALRRHVAPEASPQGEPGVILREVSNLTLASVAALKGREAELAEAVRSAHGIELLSTPSVAAAGETGFVWAGPGKWLAVSSGAADFATLPAAVADQSDGRTVIDLSGPRARETLATLIQIDLDPKILPPGAAALTHASSIAVHIWRPDDGRDGYRIACFRSYAATLWRWIVEAGRSRNIDARHEGP